MRQRRRSFLRTAGLAAGGAVLPWRLIGGAAPGQSPGATGASPAFLSLSPKDTGISWVHDNAMSPGRFLPETCGAGCAFIDYDGDGWMDLYLVNSGPSDFFTPATPIKNALYKNNRDGTFTDVTDQAGVPGGSFGMGVAVGDYDNDGHADMIVTAYGKPTLYRNNGNGTFSDVTKAAGLDIPGWTTSAVWFDYDNDGKLDLFLCSFVEFSGKANVICGDNKLGRRYYCIPRVFKPTASLLFKNNGNGTFTKTSAGTDIERALGKALGVVATDFNGDGLMDLFVANDTVQNFLFANRGPDPTGKTKWEELGLSAEVAFSANGQPRSGMGVDAADFDQDGMQDLFVANVDQEMFSLYKNRGGESFADVAHANGIAQATRLLSGWGLKFFDYDNDGHIDLMLANGHPDDMIEQYSTQVKYAEPLLLFHNEGGKLKDVSKSAGSAFGRSYPARGLAVGDFSNDGRLDVVISNNGAAPAILKNVSGEGHHWLGLALQGVTCNRDAIGAKITWSFNGQTRTRLKTSGGSYLSSHDPREVLGIGTAAKIDWVEIAWPKPSGRVERLTAVPLDRYVTAVEGKGIA
ncbi:MAG: CRTAC1 family protein [Vicinamibacteraceae bacterium]